MEVKKEIEFTVVGQGRQIGHNITAAQICPQCNSTKTELLRYDGSKPIFGCRTCGVKFSPEPNTMGSMVADTQAFPQSQPKS
jgi:ribosomal protein L37AE/L43A